MCRSWVVVGDVVVVVGEIVCRAGVVCEFQPLLVHADFDRCVTTKLSVVESRWLMIAKPSVPTWPVTALVLRVC